VFRSKADSAVRVAPFVVVAERVTTSLGCFVIEPATREYAPRGLDPHHGGSGAGVSDWRGAFKPSLTPMIDVALTRDVVVRHSVVG
jgi:hypothetical protein